VLELVENVKDVLLIEVVLGEGGVLVWAYKEGVGT
jgi:hypothetical protein